MNTDQVKRRELLYSLLGELPPRERELNAVTLSAAESNGYWLETLLLDLNGLEPVPAYFARPLGQEGPYPALLYNHWHNGQYDLGKEQFIRGHGDPQNPPYAEELTRRGYAGLCVDAWAFGERRGRTEEATFKHMLWHGQVMWGMMVYDSLRAIDYLVSRPDVVPQRLGTVGMSMGSTMAWWVAALDPRIKVCVDLCCLTDYQPLIECGCLDGHGIYYYVPHLLKHFTTAQINALIAPRPHLGTAGNHDRLTPVRGLDRIDAELREIYAAASAPEAWKLSRYEVGHLETAAMRAEIVAWLERWL
jgi:hypothetical protein